MKRADIKDRGRYVAKIDNVKTIVTAYLTPSGFRYRNERTGFFCSSSARGCWRPAHSFESWNSDTVQKPSYKEHVWCWFDGRLSIPIVDVIEDIEVNESIGEWMLGEAIRSGQDLLCDLLS